MMTTLPSDDTEEVVDTVGLKRDEDGVTRVEDPLGLLPFTKEIGENPSGKSIEGRVYNEPYRY